MVFESDIEGFKSDIDDDLTHKCCLGSQIYLRILIWEEPDTCDTRVAGKPNNNSFDSLQWTKHLTQTKFKNSEIQLHLLSDLWCKDLVLRN